MSAVYADDPIRLQGGALLRRECRRLGYNHRARAALLERADRFVAHGACRLHGFGRRACFGFDCCLARFRCRNGLGHRGCKGFGQGGCHGSYWHDVGVDDGRQCRCVTQRNLDHLGGFRGRRKARDYKSRFNRRHRRRRQCADVAVTSGIMQGRKRNCASTRRRHKGRTYQKRTYHRADHIAWAMANCIQPCQRNRSERMKCAT